MRDDGVLSWEDGVLSGSETFDVHRSSVSALRAGDYGACWQAELAVTSVTDPELPGVGSGWTYLVRGRNVNGRGPLGADSLGALRIPPAPCP